MFVIFLSYFNNLLVFNDNNDEDGNSNIDMC